MSLQKLDSTILDRAISGVDVYQSVPAFRDIANLMENKEFREFFDKYSKNHIELDTMIMFMYLYKEIDRRYPQLDKYQKTTAMKQLIDNGECRKFITSEYKKLK